MESYVAGLPTWARFCFIAAFSAWAVYSYAGRKTGKRLFLNSSRTLAAWALGVVWIPSDMLAENLYIGIVFLVCIPIICFPLVVLLFSKKPLNDSSIAPPDFGQCSSYDGKHHERNHEGQV